MELKEVRKKVLDTILFGIVGLIAFSPIGIMIALFCFIQGIRAMKKPGNFPNAHWEAGDNLY